MGKLNILMVTAEHPAVTTTLGLGRSVDGLARHLDGQGELEVRVLVPHNPSMPLSVGWEKVGDSKLYKNPGSGQVYVHQSHSFLTAPVGGSSLVVSAGSYAAGISVSAMNDFLKYGDQFDQVLQVMAQDGFRPDIVHCHDWPTAPIVDKCNAMGIKTVYTVHAGYDGRVPLSTEAVNVLDGYLHLSDLSATAVSRQLIFGCLSLQRRALSADLWTSVSEPYAKYLSDESTPQWPVQWGVSGGLDGTVDDVFREYDVTIADPTNITDSELNGLEAVKAALKTKVYQELGYKGDRDAPLISMIGRLEDIKGVNRVLDILPEVSSACVLIGGPTSDQNIKYRLGHMRSTGDHIILNRFVEYGAALQIIAASAFFLAPSWKEPEPDGYTAKEAVQRATPVIFANLDGTGHLNLQQRTKALLPFEAHWNDSIETYNARLLAAINHAAEMPADKLRTMRRDLVNAVGAGVLSWEPAVTKCGEAYHALVPNK